VGIEKSRLLSLWPLHRRDRSFIANPVPVAFVSLSKIVAADGTPIGRDFLINSTTTGNQHSPAIAGGQGGAVVVWISDPATNVYARRIAAH